MRLRIWFVLLGLLPAFACSARGEGASGDAGAQQGAAGSSVSGAGGSPMLMLPGALPGASGSGASDACIDVSVQFERETPSVVLLIDQSNTMTIPFEPGAQGRSRWNTVRDVLMDPTTGLVPNLQNAVRFGLALYSAKSPDICPELARVSLALGNYEAIRDLYAGQEVLHHTPTSESLSAVTKELASYAEPGPKAVVLATDGNPDNCKNLDDNNSPDGGASSKALVIKAAEEAFAQGISTFVISVGDEISEQHLADLAKAGRGGAADATFYRALETEALTHAFDSILKSVISCDFKLNGTVSGNDAPRGSVMLDGQSLEHGGPDGWDMPATDTVRLQGAACDQAKLSADQLDIEFPCGTIVPK
jgi:hypothetical protein